jgi:RNA polymerase sigma factor (sigma-70 family)
VAREALVGSAHRCRVGEPAELYLRRCITGALQYHLRDRVRLVRIPIARMTRASARWGTSASMPQQKASPLSADIENWASFGCRLTPSMLDQLAAPEAESHCGDAVDGLALEQLVEQLPAAQATALRLTVLEGLSLRQAAERLEISCMSVQRAQKKALVALRQRLAGGG